MKIIETEPHLTVELTNDERWLSEFFDAALDRGFSVLDAVALTRQYNESLGWAETTDPAFLEYLAR